MATDLTAQEITDALALCHAATPGPWKADDTIFTDGAAVVSEASSTGCVGEGPYEHEPDAAFIAAARTILPRALTMAAELLELRERIEALARMGHTVNLDEARSVHARVEPFRPMKPTRLTRAPYCGACETDWPCDVWGMLDEIAALRAWKQEALAVERQWDVQAVGRALEVPLGANIRPAILPAIEALRAEVARLTAYITEKEQSRCHGEWPCEANTACAALEAENARLRRRLTLTGEELESFVKAAWALNIAKSPHRLRRAFDAVCDRLTAEEKTHG